MPTHDRWSDPPAAPAATRPTETDVGAAATSDVAERHEKLTEDVDAILDEIDDVLETNAEDFVR